MANVCREKKRERWHIIAQQSDITSLAYYLQWLAAKKCHLRRHCMQRRECDDIVNKCSRQTPPGQKKILKTSLYEKIPFTCKNRSDQHVLFIRKFNGRKLTLRWSSLFDAVSAKNGRNTAKIVYTNCSKVWQRRGVLSLRVFVCTPTGVPSLISTIQQ